MSKLTSAIGKPLKGVSSASASSNSELANSVISAISNGSVTLNNIDIAGGTINNVTIGVDGGGPIFATTITSGAPNGTGYDVIFYGDTIGEYASWTASLGLWTVSGDMFVTGITDLGNIRIAGNTISSTNTNGDIIIDPAGTGCLIVNSCIEQHAVTGDATFLVDNGVFSATSSGNLSLTSTAGEFRAVSAQQGSITSNNGDVTISAGAAKTISGITLITTGATPVITTSLQHNLEVGDNLKFASTNSIPIIDGDYIVTQVIDTVNFRITPGFPVTTLGTSGTFTKNTDINLTAANNINIPYDVKLTFGADTNYIMDTSSPLNEMNIVAAGDINLTPSSGNDINIPDNIGLTFGADTRKIESNGTDVTIQSGGGIILNSTTLSVNSTNVTFTDPIVKLDSTTPVSNNTKDKGIEFNYYDTAAKLGWFGYDNSTDAFSFFKAATNTSEIISGTLGDARFAAGNFTSLNMNGGNISAGSIDVCNLNCTGLMTLTGTLGIKLNTPTVIVPQISKLQFGETGYPLTYISKTVDDDLLVQSQGHILLTPGGTGNDVVLPTNSALVLNGIGGSQKIESTTNTELTISSTSFLNLNQVSGGVRLTEGLPIIFNQDETTKITGDSAGNMIVNVGNSLNLIPNSGQITIPVAKRIELGSPTSYIGTTALNTIVLNTSGTLGVTSTGNQTYTSNTANINLSPVSAVILPANISLQLGDATQFLKSDNSNNVILSSTGSQSIISTGSNINLTPSTSIDIPYSKPLQFGSSSEAITGTAGNLTLTASTSNVSGNFIVNGGTTNINSTTVTFDDPILTIGGDTISVSDDNKDRGIEYHYYDAGVAKLGYFGMDDTDHKFMYVPIATNTGEVISGALGDVKFAGGSFTSLNLNNGTISAVNTITSNNNLTLTPGSGNDLVFNLDSGTNVTIPVNVDLLFGGENTKIYSDGSTLHVVNSLTVDGSTTIYGDLVVTGNTSIVGGATTNLTVERFSVAGGAASSPNGSSNISFISVSSTGVATGTMTIASFDGFLKNICISSLAAGASYELLFPTGRLLDPGTGSTIAKKMIFTMPGQSVQFVFDNVLSTYILTSGGGELILA